MFKLPKLLNLVTLTAISVFATTSALESSAQTTSADQKFFSMRAPAKVVYEWEVSVDEAAENPNINYSNLAAVRKAVNEGILDEMTTTITEYEFDANGQCQGWVVNRSQLGPTSVRVKSFPGVFNVTYRDGRPTRFVLDTKLFQESLDNGNLFLDAYEVGLSEYRVSYNANGLPESLEGKCMEFFGGGRYYEQYSQYKFDKNGNWIRRTVKTSYQTVFQYRSYKY